MEMHMPRDLADIRKIQIDENLPAQKRLEDFLNQIGNPYFFKCGNTIVKLEFSEGEPSFEEKLTDYFINLKSR